MKLSNPSFLALALLCAGFLACGESDDPSADGAGPSTTAARAPVRRLIESLPLEIVEPGTYALAHDLDGQPADGGIVVRCSDVVLDLGEFTLRGGVGSTTGVIVAEGCTGVAVRNGVLKAWGEDGMDATAASGVSVENVEASLNGGAGIRVGDHAVLTACTATFNWGGRGLWAGDDARLLNCVAEDNALGGLWTGARAEVRGCRVRRSTYGAGIRAGDGSRLEDCDSSDNLREGLAVGRDCVLVRCRAAGNVALGIGAGDDARLEGCEATNTMDGPGVRVGANSKLVGCRALDNAGRGIVAGPASELTEVEIRGNRGD